MKKKIVGNWLTLIVSGILSMLVCMVLRCEAKGEGLKSEVVVQAAAGQKTEIQPAKKEVEIGRVRFEKTPEEKRVEKEVLKWVKKIERKCSLSNDIY
ncbi:MAG: hypothetical protein ABIJ30_04570 [bacterium]